MTFDELWEELRKENPELINTITEICEEIEEMGCPPDRNPGFCDDPDAEMCFNCKLDYLANRKQEAKE